MGKNSEAAAVLRGGERVVYLLDGLPIRLDWDYNTIMRQVAGQYNVDLVDAASVLEKDPYVFIDFCHFDSAGHRKVAELLAADLAKGRRKINFTDSVQWCSSISEVCCCALRRSEEISRGSGLRPIGYFFRSRSAVTAKPVWVLVLRMKLSIFS